MQLTETQSRELLRAYGAYVTEACDRCGGVLGPIRWTIRETSLAGKRRGAMYCGRTCRMRKVRKDVQDCANIVNTPIQKKRVTDAISAFGYGGINPELGHAHELSNERELRT